MTHKNIIIIGGGPVGLSTALMLSRQGKKVTIIDQGLDKSTDGRILALSYASYQVLNSLNAWPNDYATQINTVQISHKGLGVSQINASAINLECLGYTIDYSKLCNNLLTQVLQNDNIEYIIGNVTEIQDNAGYAYVEYQDSNDLVNIITCELLIMAEGGKLLAKMNKKRIDYDYEQQAIIFHIETKAPHNGVAYERFAGLGPLVLLPHNDHYVVVWSLENKLADYYKQNPDEMINQLDSEFTNRLGKAKLVSSLNSFPLKLIQTTQRVHKKVVIIGNSAQIVHPVSAQGLNLGLRDAVILCDMLASANKVDLELLNNFNDIRQKDADAVIGFTHFIATKLETNNKFLSHLRGAGIVGVSNLPAIQNFIARSLIFGI